MSVFPSIKRFIGPPSPSFNYQARFVRQWLRRLLTQGNVVLDVGSGRRELVPGVINIDIAPLPGVQIVSNAESLAIKSESIDAVVCSALLEHVPNPEKVISEIYRCVKINRQVYFEVPFLQPGHLLQVGDYRRYTVKGLQTVLHQFKCNEMGVCIGPFSVLAWYFRKLPTIFIRSRFLVKGIEFILGWFTFWIKYFDVLCKRATDLETCCAGVFFYGEKIKDS